MAERRKQQMTDTILKSAAMEILIEKLGVVEAERFIMLILREPFDYTAWRNENFSDSKTVTQLNEEAKEYWNKLNQA